MSRQTKKTFELNTELVQKKRETEKKKEKNYIHKEKNM